MNANTGDFMTDDVKKQAFRVGYRYAIGTASFYDWTRIRRKTKPADARPGFWAEEFDRFATAGFEIGKRRLDEFRKELDRQTEHALTAYFYPEPAFPTIDFGGDPLASIDAGVDDLILA